MVAENKKSKRLNKLQQCAKQSNLTISIAKSRELRKASSSFTEHVIAGGELYIENVFRFAKFLLFRTNGTILPDPRQ